MLVWKEFVAWRNFFRWLGTPLREWRRKREEKKRAEEFFKGVEINVIQGPGKTYSAENLKK